MFRLFSRKFDPNARPPDWTDRTCRRRANPGVMAKMWCWCGFQLSPRVEVIDHVHTTSWTCKRHGLQLLEEETDNART